MLNKKAEDFPLYKRVKNKQTIIAIDYDGTITASHDAWGVAINAFIESGLSVIIVTMRFKNEPLEGVDENIPVIYTGRKAKKQFVEALGIRPDIWCDDNPQFIFQDAWLGVENAGHLNQWDHSDYDKLRTTNEDTKFW